MAVFVRRSPNSELNVGATDGKYRKARPNTTVAPGMGEELVRENRRSLNPFFNYGFIDSEESTMVSPGASDAKKGSKTSTPVSDIDNYMTQQHT
jgi:hypothetical protein